MSERRELWLEALRGRLGIPGGVRYGCPSRLAVPHSPASPWAPGRSQRGAPFSRSRQTASGEGAHVSLQPQPVSPPAPCGPTRDSPPRREAFPSTRPSRPARLSRPARRAPSAQQRQQRKQQQQRRDGRERRERAGCGHKGAPCGDGEARRSARGRGGRAGLTAVARRRAAQRPGWRRAGAVEGAEQAARGGVAQLQPVARVRQLEEAEAYGLPFPDTPPPSGHRTEGPTQTHSCPQAAHPCPLLTFVDTQAPIAAAQLARVAEADLVTIRGRGRASPRQVAFRATEASPHNPGPGRGGGGSGDHGPVAGPRLTWAVEATSGGPPWRQQLEAEEEEEALRGPCPHRPQPREAALVRTRPVLTPGSLRGLPGDLGGVVL
ncbi:hypothetical protein MC885_016534 [Smutsia gigantea]|nr:hypothetical protein MC885_016534 [Smutsia gigantea]